MTKSNRQTTVGDSNTTVTYNVEEMIAYIRQNPNVALGIHQRLIKDQYAQRLDGPIESSTPQTPKRNLDSSENDEVQISKQLRVLSNGKQKNNGQMSESTVPNPAQPSNNNPRPLQSRTLEHQQRRLPFEQLKRAVASNLPCFIIEYDQVENSRNRPSDVSAASIIEEHFKQQGISITFSLVGYIGNKLKLGVNNKESYATLISTDKWPSQINNININVIKPKFIPDSFALVVRYVPLQYDDEYVKEEIERNIQSVENVRRIHYSFQRRTNDFRFIVKDLRQYNSTLKLGRISIGNSFCTITPFLTGNRMTYCTRCWCVGYMRDKCEQEHPRCRICLDSLIENQTHECSNIVRCAQCDGPHHSLSSECEKIAQYRSDLKEQVNNAISTGKLHRLVPEDRPQPKQFQMKQNEFPTLPSLMPHTTPWKQTTTQQLVTANMNGSEETTKMLLLINQNTLEMKENIRHIDEKLDRINENVNQTTLDIELHQQTLEKLLLIFASLVEDVIWPTTKLDRQPQLQKLFSSLKSLSSTLKTDYTSRRKRSLSPPPRISPSQQPSKSSNNIPNNESDPNMSN